MKQINSFVFAMCLLGLNACTTTEPSTDGGEVAEAPAPAATPAAPEPVVEYGSFTEDQLYQAIVSELSAQRGQVVDAGNSYFDLAMSTRDVTVIQRAIQFASVNGDTNALLQLGLEVLQHALVMCVVVGVWI